MKAIVVQKFGGPEVLNVDTLPIPEPGPGQVLVKVMSCGVNPVDTYKRSGLYPVLPSLPWVPGSDASGIVEKVGEGTTALKIGDRVWLSATNSGAYAQFCVAPQVGAHVLPESLSFDQGAALWTSYATAYHALYHSTNLTPSPSTHNSSKKILVHGASGGVGLACLQYAVHSGVSQVLGTASSKEGLEELQKAGAIPFNHKEVGYMGKIMDRTGGVDVIVEMLANVNLGKDLTILGRGGCVAVVGNRGPVEINARDLMRNRSSVVGVSLQNATTQEVADMVTSISAGMREGFINPKIGQTYKLTETPKAHDAIINTTTGALGKVIVHPWEL